MTHPTDDSLKPCPFCGAGTTEITPNGRMWTGMKYSEPSSVSVRHWCDSVPGQPSRMLERVGRDEASAIEAWNTRALLAAQPAVQQPAEDAGLLDRHGKIRGDLKASAYCVGNEYKPFHPSASHVRPEWRDGWNACFVAAIKAQGGKQ